jgi:hypothetical protein
MAARLVSAAMKIILQIAVALFIGYIVIDSLMNMKESPFHGPSTTPSPSTLTPEKHIGDTFVTTHAFISLYSATMPPRRSSCLPTLTLQPSSQWRSKDG